MIQLSKKDWMKIMWNERNNNKNVKVLLLWKNSCHSFISLSKFAASPTAVQYSSLVGQQTAVSDDLNKILLNFRTGKNFYSKTQKLFSNYNT